MRASLVLIGSVLLCGCFSPPGGQITESSKTPACRAELTGALNAVKRDRGLGFDVSERDVDVLMNSGTASKNYARDGIRISMDFGLEPTEGGCSLVAYKMTRSEPGSTTTTGRQGSVALTQCTCTAGD